MPTTVERVTKLEYLRRFDAWLSPKLKGSIVDAQAITDNKQVLTLNQYNKETHNIDVLTVTVERDTVDSTTEPFKPKQFIACTYTQADNAYNADDLLLVDPA